jgi:hypothetical protein
LAVDAFFGAGALNIEITSVGEQHANLIANGSDFFVDANNDSLFNPLSELSASLASLERIQVTSPDQVGVFRWIGDFTAAPLSELTTLNIHDIQRVEIQASANVVGQASVFASDSVAFHSAISFQRDLIVDVDLGGSISDSATSQVTVLGNLSLRTNSPLSLGDELTGSWKVNGLTTIESTSSVSLGEFGSWDSRLLDIRASSAMVYDIDGVTLSQIDILGNFQLHAAGQIDDSFNSNLYVGGDFRIEAPALSLSEDPGDFLIVGNRLSIDVDNQATIFSPGTVSLGRLEVDAGEAVVYEDDSTLLDTIHTQRDFTLTSVSMISAGTSSSIQIGGDFKLHGESIVFSSESSLILDVTNRSIFEATRSIQILNPGSVEFGILSATGQTIDIDVDSSIVIERLVAASNAQVRSLGSISDTSHSTIQVGGDLDLSGISIALSSAPATTVSVLGTIHLNGNTGDISIGSAGTAHFGSISAFGRNIAIYEDSSSHLEVIRATNDFYIESADAITDSPGAQIIVSGNASFHGTALSLADSSSDVLTVTGRVNLEARSGDISIGSPGTVHFGSISAFGRNIAIYEDSSTRIDELSSTGNAMIRSTDSITDGVAANIQVNGNLVLQGGSIDLATDSQDRLTVLGSSNFIADRGDVSISPLGYVQLGVISASGRTVVLQEDHETILYSLASTGLLRVSSTGDISDAIGSRIDAGSLEFYSQGQIILSDSPSDSLSVLGGSFFRSSGDVTIEAAGLVSLGSVGFHARNVTVHEDGSTHLDGTVCRQLFVFSEDLITQSGIDRGAGVRWLQVDGDASFDLSASPGTVELQRISSSPTIWTSDGRVADNRIDGPLSATGLLGSFSIRNLSSTAMVRSLGGLITNASIWHVNNSVLLPDDLEIHGELNVIAGVDTSLPELS